MRYFLTGHTGFKGSWYSLKLKLQGHEVFGYSLDPLENGLFVAGNIKSLLSQDTRADIRDASLLKSEIERVQPDVVVHMAAQPLVSTSYQYPNETFEINVGGTLNLLNACVNVTSLKAIAIITTDKVYQNTGDRRAFVESDALGVGDPYSTSKAMADLLAQSWMLNITKTPIGVFRAGNVIGGGDVSINRLIPDLVNAERANRAVLLRNPGAVRPWQHVLDCLAGYQNAIDWLIKNQQNVILNFGPDFKDYKSVEDVAKKYIEISGKGSVNISKDNSLREADFLTLNSSKARELLSWKDKLDFNESLLYTHNWYKAQAERLDMLEFSKEQIKSFELKELK
jgi:CDP-glucose 4,6-dehydratase